MILCNDASARELLTEAGVGIAQKELLQFLGRDEPERQKRLSEGDRMCLLILQRDVTLILIDIASKDHTLPDAGIRAFSFFCHLITL